MHNLIRHITKASEDIARLNYHRDSEASRAAIKRAQASLEQVLAAVKKLESELFQLQEQNQQLRRDLSDQVCARLCENGRPNAS